MQNVNYVVITNVCKSIVNAINYAINNLKTTYNELLGNLIVNDVNNVVTLNFTDNNIKEFEASNNFTIDTNKQATLSYSNNQIIFNIPLDFPEALNINSSSTSVKSFAVKTVRIHPMFLN